MTDNTDALPPLPASQAFSLARSVYTADDMHAYARAALASRDAERQGEVTVTCNERGEAVAVTRTDDEHRIMSVIWERASPSPAQPPVVSESASANAYAMKRGLDAKLDAALATIATQPAQPKQEPQPATVDCEHWNGRFCGKSGPCYRPSCIPRVTIAAQPAHP